MRCQNWAWRGEGSYGRLTSEEVQFCFFLEISSKNSLVLRRLSEWLGRLGKVFFANINNNVQYCSIKQIYIQSITDRISKYNGEYFEFKRHGNTRWKTGDLTDLLFSFCLNISKLNVKMWDASNSPKLAEITMEWRLWKLMVINWGLIQVYPHYYLGVYK